MKKHSRILAAVLALVLILSAVSFAFAAGNTAGSGDTATPTQQEGSQTSQEEIEAAQKQRADLYTIGAIITLAAIIVGIREKRRGR